MWISYAPADWPRLALVDAQLYDLLYRGFGVAPGDTWRHEGAHGALAVAVSDDGDLFGSARLLAGEGGEARQIRQLAVVPHARRAGVGRALVFALEQCAASEGALTSWLYSRDSAFDFYERLGYQFDGETFASELTGIPHRRMVKDLAEWRCRSCRRRSTGIWLPASAANEL